MSTLLQYKCEYHFYHTSVNFVIISSSIIVISYIITYFVIEILVLQILVFRLADFEKQFFIIVNS